MWNGQHIARKKFYEGCQTEGSGGQKSSSEVKGQSPGEDVGGGRSRRLSVKMIVEIYS